MGKNQGYLDPDPVRLIYRKNNNNNMSVQLEKTDQRFYPNYFLCQWWSYYLSVKNYLCKDNIPTYGTTCIGLLIVFEKDR